MAKTTGTRYIADALRAYGVDHLFFVPQMLLETLTSMEGMGIRRVMVHGEKAAAYMADGYARASRRPGVCMAQHVGASNLAAGLKDAYLACSPVIAMTGGPAPLARHRHAYQELEDFNQFAETTKFNAHVDHFDRAYGGDPQERGREMWGFSKVSFAKIAESMGCRGIRVEKPGELPGALQEALNAQGPVVIDAVTDHRAFAQKTWTGAAAAGH